MKNFLATFAKGFDSLNNAFNLLSQLALIFMIVTICYDVFMRYVMRNPTDWVLEVNTFLVIFATIVPAASLMRSGSHLRVTFLTEKMPAAWQRATGMLDTVVGLVVSFVLASKGFDMMYMALKYDERMSTPLGTPYAIPYSFLPIGFGLLFIAYTLHGIDYILKGKDMQPEEVDPTTSVL